MKMYPALVMLITLTACSKDYRYDTKESTKALLPSLVQYSEKETRGAVMEVKTGACPIHIEFTKDYIQIRDRIRLIKKELK